MTIREAAKELKVSYASASRWLHKGLLRGEVNPFTRRATIDDEHIKQIKKDPSLFPSLMIGRKCRCKK